jgi:hypothetical protein
VKRLAAFAGLVGLLLAVSGCTVIARPEGDFGLSPECKLAHEEPDRTVILMAQAVPTASQLPCIRGDLPPGWMFADYKIRNGLAQFWLDSDLEGIHALLVQVSRGCDVQGATPVSSDQPEMQQYERVTRLAPGYGGQRYYVYSGGCTTYRFNLQGESRAQPLAAIAASLTFVSRETLRQQIHNLDPRLKLDPGSET